ncbi:integrase catalytic region [Brucella sp. NF 2653]|nr:integrase catalytic region [Brucella sp. NF 2653]
MVETFFKTLKSELIWKTVFQTRHDAEIAIAVILTAFIIPSAVILHSTI